jgi:hypothetical protein
MGVRGKFKSAVKRNFVYLMESLEYYMKKYSVDNREDLLKIFDEKQFKIRKPKYIHLNRLAKTKSKILEQLSNDNFVRLNKKSLDLPPTISNNHEAKFENQEIKNFDLKSIIETLKNNQFIKDDIIKYLYIFSPESLIDKKHLLFQNGHLFQIDKVSSGRNNY